MEISGEKRVRAFVTNDRPGSKLLKCYQHIGSEFKFYVLDFLFKFCVEVVYADVVIGGARGWGGAELAYDKNLYKKLFDGEVEYERFCWYLRYASMNTFIHLDAVY